ncbi:AAA family ATPase [Acinetobacter pittii]|uniref:AAA family ATPase n=1 Tax=Acinetobacter pittii TaxID=48296 RepID=UPI00355B8B3B
MAIKFKVLLSTQRVPTSGKSQGFLLTDNWDDWFKYNTQYCLIVFDEHGQRHRIGDIKVGQFGMSSDQRRANIPESFETLSEEFFSLGQDDSYYESLNELGADTRDLILRALKDIALDNDLFLRALDEKVTGISLLRGVSKATVKGQFSRLAKGGVRLSKYKFFYTAPSLMKSKQPPLELSFTVKPESMPPSNIHVLIGRNGVGKTHLLNNMSHSLSDKKPDYEKLGTFSGEFEDLSQDMFSNLVSVTFSAFDPFEPLPNRRDRSEGLPCAYVGLKRSNADKDGKKLPPKSPEALSREFGASVVVCSQGARRFRWQQALKMLETDPIFGAIDVATLADDRYVDEEARKLTAKQLFSKLSSGHKIVLLTITRLVETVEERTLVLLDEPEAHLHPPLLSAFIRALSDLLVNRNGVAIIATHSPVILQEVPSHCVWKIRRDGRIMQAERPEFQTFGENVGVLTREVFGLEVTDSGFHKLLKEAIDEGDEFDDIVDKFNQQLGGEARALIRALLANPKVNQ